MQRAIPASVVEMQGDARQLPNQDSSIDLVVTSPPYATALDYSRAHFLAVPWMGRFWSKPEQSWH